MSRNKEHRPNGAAAPLGVPPKAAPLCSLFLLIYPFIVIIISMNIYGYSLYIPYIFHTYIFLFPEYVPYISPFVFLNLWSQQKKAQVKFSGVL